MVEGARLESVFRGNSNVGSNPTLSASRLVASYGPVSRISFLSAILGDSPGSVCQFHARTNTISRCEALTAFGFPAVETTSRFSLNLNEQSLRGSQSFRGIDSNNQRIPFM